MKTDKVEIVFILDRHSIKKAMVLKIGAMNDLYRNLRKRL